MKKFFCVLVLICLVFMACDMGNNGSGNGDGDGDGSFSVSNRNIGIKSLYISNIPVNNGRAVSGSTITTLSYINDLGQNTPFYFVSPSGKNIVLNVREVQQLDDKRIVVNFTSYYEITAEGNVFTIGETIYTSGRALIDMESGKVYDFQEYKNILFVSNDLLFTLENQTLYKVDLNNISVAVPLNNPTYNPVFNIMFPILFENKILAFPLLYTADKLSIDINNDFPPKPVRDATLTPDLCSFIENPTPLGVFSIQFTHEIKGIVMTDLSGKPHFYSFNGADRYDGDVGIKYFTCSLSIDDDGNILLSNYYEGEHTFKTNWNPAGIISNGEYPTTFLVNSAGVGKIGGFIDFYEAGRIKQSFVIPKSQSIILYSSNGFIHLKKKANEIQVESTALSMPKVDAYGSFINKDNYLYFLEGSSIKRLYLASGETPEVVYTDSRLLTSGTTIDYLMASGSNLIFYQYADDNVSVNTYSMAMYQQGATPKLMSSSSIDVRDIIELDF